MSDITGGASLGRATAVLDLDASGFQRGINQVQLGFASLGQIVRQQYFGISNVVRTTARLGEIAAGGIALAYKASLDWENGIALLETRLYDTNKTLAENQRALRAVDDLLRQVATSTPNTTRQIQALATQVAALGVGPDLVVPLTKSILDFSNVTGTAADLVAPSFARIAQTFGLPAAGAERLGSAVLELDRKTIASSTDILEYAQRLAGAGAAAHASAPQVLALATAVATSAQASPRIAIMGVQQLLSVINNLVTTGGPGLQKVAEISGVTAAEFQRNFAQDSVAAIGLFLEGLGRMSQSGRNADNALSGLGITAPRMTSAIIALAQSQANAAGTSASLANSVELANRAYARGGLVTSAAKSLYQDTREQLSLLRNQIVITAVSYGTLFLPILRAVTGVLRLVVAGLAALPTWMRILIATSVALSAALLLGFAIFTKLIVSIVQGVTAIRAFVTAMRQKAIAEAADAEATALAAAEANANTIAMIREAMAAGDTALALEILAGAEESAAAATIAAEAAASGGLLGFLAIAGTIAAIIATAIPALFSLGRAHHKHALEAKLSADAEANFTNALSQGTDATRKAAFDILEGAKAFDIFKKHGIDSVEAVNVAIRQATPAATAKLLDALVKVLQTGSGPDRKKASDTIEAIRGIARAELDYAERTRDAARAGVTLDDSIDSTKLEAKAALEAIKGLADAQQKATDSESDLGAAQLRYTDAQYKAAHAALEQARALREAERARADAAARVDDTQAAIELALRKYAETRLTSAQVTDRLRDAENALADARVRAQQANQEIQDALYQIRFLRGEGAGARDITQAEETVGRARADAADAADALIDKLFEHGQVRSQIQREADQAERDLARTRRDHRAAIDDLAASLVALNKQRQDAANNKAVRLANRELVDALHAVRDAIIARGTAQADLIKEQLAMNGKILLSREYDRTLALQILNTAGNMRGPGADAARRYALAVKNNIGPATDTINTKLSEQVQHLQDIDRLLDNIITKYKKPPFLSAPGPLGQSVVGGTIPSINPPTYTPPVIHGATRQHGGMSDSGGWFLLHPNELVLPLNDINRTMQLLASVGLLTPDLAGINAATGSVAGSAGDTFHLTTLQGATASEIADEFDWRRASRVRTRS